MYYCLHVFSCYQQSWALEAFKPKLMPKLKTFYLLFQNWIETAKENAIQNGHCKTFSCQVSSLSLLSTWKLTWFPIMVNYVTVHSIQNEIPWSWRFVFQISLLVKINIAKSLQQNLFLCFDIYNYMFLRYSKMLAMASCD